MIDQPDDLVVTLAIRVNRAEPYSVRWATVEQLSVKDNALLFHAVNAMVEASKAASQPMPKAVM